MTHHEVERRLVDAAVAFVEEGRACLKRAAELSAVERSSMSNLECLTDDNEATRLHYDAVDHVVWLDTDIGVRDGLLVGVGPTKSKALQDAADELKGRVEDLRRALMTLPAGRPPLARRRNKETI